MATYEIKNYIKLLCIRIDHFESFIVAEKNTNQIEEIEEFINRYDNPDALQIVKIQMDNMEMITFDDVKKIIHNVHVFDYMRHLVNDGHKMLALPDVSKTSIDLLISHMLSDKT